MPYTSGRLNSNPKDRSRTWTPTQGWLDLDSKRNRTPTTQRKLGSISKNSLKLQLITLPLAGQNLLCNVAWGSWPISGSSQKPPVSADETCCSVPCSPVAWEGYLQVVKDYNAFTSFKTSPKKKSYVLLQRAKGLQVQPEGQQHQGLFYLNTESTRVTISLSQSSHFRKIWENVSHSN